TAEGLQKIADYGLHPDVVFIDADHAYESVSADLRLARQLFPQARIIGDDYDYGDVHRAVDEFAASKGFQVEPIGTGWRAWRLVSPFQSSGADATEDGSLLLPTTDNTPLTAGKSDVVSGLTSIIIVTSNQLTYTKECVDSIRLRTDEPYELI